MRPPRTEDPFRALIALMSLGILGIRVYFRRQSATVTGRVELRERRRDTLVRGLAGLAGLGSVLAYLLAPQRLRRAAIPLPSWLRWLGAGLGLGAVPLLAWVHGSLGRNFAPTVQLRERQALVTSGPYRRVRHPMYTVFYLFALALFLVSANWGVGLAWLAGLTAVLGPRVRREEAAMLDKFDDDYRAYMRRTGRFLPRFSRPDDSTDGGYR